MWYSTLWWIGNSILEKPDTHFQGRSSGHGVQQHGSNGYGAVYSLTIQNHEMRFLFFSSEDGGCKFLENIGTYLPEEMVLHLIRPQT